MIPVELSATNRRLQSLKGTFRRALPTQHGTGQGATTPWMVIPAVVLVFIVMGYPWFYSAWMSLHNIDYVLDVHDFVGLANYTAIFSESAAQQAFLRTVYFASVAVAGTLCVGLLMALVLNEAFKGRGLMRSIVLLPWAMSPVAIGVLWGWIYDGQYGSLNSILLRLGVIDAYVPWLREGFRALNLVAVVHVWHQAPLAALLLLAGLQGIPPSLYRAAKVDGAGPWQRFIRITLPSLRPMLLIATILVTVNAVMQFDLIYVITGGGPGSATTVFSWLGYATVFVFSRVGAGTAILYLLSLVCFMLALLYLRVLATDKQSSRRAEDGDYDAPRLRSNLLETGYARRRAPVVIIPRRRFVTGRRADLLRGILLRLGVALISVWSLFPVYVLLVSSFSHQADLYATPAPVLPSFTLDHFRSIFGTVIGERGFATIQATQIPKGITNSLLIASAVVLLNVVLGGLAGYAAARHPTSRLVGVSLLGMLTTRMLPPLSIAVPMFYMLSSLHLVDKKSTLIVVYTAITLPLVSWMLKGYIETIPITIERAALIDGASRGRLLVQIILPLARPGLVAAGMFAFIVAWNEFPYALVLTKTSASQTIPIVLAGFVTQTVHFTQSYGAAFAAAAIAVLPPVLIAFFGQRYLVQGLLSGGSKE